MPFESKIEEKILTVQIPSSMSLNLEQEWSSHVNTWLLEEASLYVLDFSQTIAIQPTALRLFVVFAKTLEKNEKHLASIGLSESLVLQARNLGLEKRLNPCLNKEVAMDKAGLRSKPRIDLQLLNQIVTSTLFVMTKQAATNCKPLKPQIYKENETLPRNEAAIAGIISLSTEQFRGSITLKFPKVVFLKIYSNMLGESVLEIGDETKDAAAELLNMIYGHAKVELNGKGGKLPPSIPRITTDEKILSRATAQSPLLSVPFQMDSGVFHIEIDLESEQASSQGVKRVSS